MDPASGSTPNAEAGGSTVLVWHPALGAIAWIWRWAWWSLLLSVVVEAVSVGLFPTLRLGAMCARAVVIWVGIGAALLPLDFAHGCVRQYSRLRRLGAPARVAAVRPLGIFSAFALIYAGILGWGFHVLQRGLLPLRGVGVVPSSSVSAHDVWIEAFAALVTLGAAALLWMEVATTWRLHRQVLRALGRGYLVKGCALMALMRMRQNRHDFFTQAPLVANVRALFVAVVAHEFVRGTAVSGVLPGLIVLLSIVATAADLCPPFWLLLGRSRFDTYHLFTTLRMDWDRFGLNLLDRSSDEWTQYYMHWRESWARAGVPMARVFLNNPRIHRVWSLRPRGELWIPSALNLMAFVPAIVIDARAASRPVDDEILWVVECGYVEKVWLVAADDGSAPALHSAFEWAAAEHLELPPGSFEALSGRVVGKDRLRQARWSGGTLVVPGSANEFVA